jgi:O-methyltransferase
MEKAVKAAINMAAPYSKCPFPRLKVFAEALVRLDQQGIEGDVVECGVWRGGIAILARLLSPRRVIWLYDTFAGMAGRSAFDVSRGNYRMPEGKAAVPARQVMANIAQTATLNGERIVFVQGKVEETLLIEENLPSKIAMLHLDTDWFHSTKIELEVLWPRLRRHGVLILDDYGHWKGCKKAVDEYFPPRARSHIVIDDTAIMMVKA